MIRNYYFSKDGCEIYTMIPSVKLAIEAGNIKFFKDHSSNQIRKYTAQQYLTLSTGLFGEA